MRLSSLKFNFLGVEIELRSRFTLFKDLLPDSEGISRIVQQAVQNMADLQSMRQAGEKIPFKDEIRELRDTVIDVALDHSVPSDQVIAAVQKSVTEEIDRARASSATAAEPAAESAEAPFSPKI